MCRDRARRRAALLLALATAMATALPAAARDDVATRRARFDALPADQREAIARRAQAWDALPPGARAARRDARAAWATLPADQRAALRRAAERFAAMPPEERASLRARWDALDDYERRGWALGPALGAAWPRLQALLAQLPADQRAPMLQALQALPAQGIADLAVLAQRTPPQDRDALRRALLATPEAGRAAWLRDRVGG